MFFGEEKVVSTQNIRNDLFDTLISISQSTMIHYNILSIEWKVGLNGKKFIFNSVHTFNLWWLGV